MDLTLPLAIWWIAAIIAGGYVAGQKKRHVVEGLIFGVFFGPLGVLIVACLPEGTKNDGWLR
jgi:hypothetical protein